MNDIETRIRELVNATVDAELGPRRAAPPFALAGSRSRAAGRPGSLR